MTVRGNFTEEWRRHWQQSIAVRISAVVLWVLVPTVLLVLFALVYRLEDDIRQRFEEGVDVAMHRAIMTYAAAPEQGLAALRAELEQSRQAFGFDAVEIEIDGEKLLVGATGGQAVVLTRQSTLQSHAALRSVTAGAHATAMHDPALVLRAYHPDAAVLARDKQKQILIPIVGGLLVFGIFLIHAIRIIVQKPLQALVDATIAVAAGDADRRLDERRMDEFGHLARFFNAMLDELTEKQHNLAVAAEEANRASQAKSVFLANTSHELRTPLNAIIGYSEMMMEETSHCRQNLSCREDLQKIRESGRHLLGLINNILDLAKVEAGKAELFVEEISIWHLVQEVTATMKPMLSKANDRLQMECAETIGTMRTDQTKLRQILLNLLSNAIKFTENGNIVVRVWKQDAEAETRVYFRVEDSGIGIAEDKLHHLFQTFSQIDVSSTRKYGGSGLGLVISKRFCTMLGGDIVVSSQPGHGTSFEFYLPQTTRLRSLAEQGIVVRQAEDDDQHGAAVVKS